MNIEDKLGGNLIEEGSDFPFTVNYDKMIEKMMKYQFTDPYEFVKDLESLKSFEEGVKLTRVCQKSLQDAEQKVQILLEKNGQQTLESFNDE